MKTKKKDATYKDRLENFRYRMAARIEHGWVSRWAKAVGLTPNSISRQLNQPGYALPDVFSVCVAAEALQVNPAWLAFGTGHQDPVLAACGDRVAQELHGDPDLGLVIESWLSRPDNRHQITGWAKDMLPRPNLLACLATRASARGEKLSQLEQWAATTLPRQARPIASGLVHGPRNETLLNAKEQLAASAALYVSQHPEDAASRQACVDLLELLTQSSSAPVRKGRRPKRRGNKSTHCKPSRR